MPFQDISIKRKVMSVNMLTSITALVLTAAAFMLYDWFSYRENLVSHLLTTASIVSDYNTGTLIFQDEESAQQSLNALKTEPHIVAAALYDDQGNIYVRYPVSKPLSTFPASPGKLGHHFEGGNLVIFQPSIQGEKRAGTLYLKSDLRGLYQRLRRYGGISSLVLISSIFLALLIST